MARSPNCTGAPTCRGRVDVSITYPDPDIVTLDTPEALPTSEPATAQVSMTVGSQHLATWSPFELEHTNSAILYTTGKNNSGSTVAVYYRIAKNGQSIATGSESIYAGAYFPWSHHRFPDVQIGDVLACKLWASAGGCDWRGKALAIWPSRIGPKKLAMSSVVVELVACSPIGVNGNRQRPFFMWDGYPETAGMAGTPSKLALLVSHPVYGMITPYFGGTWQDSFCAASGSNEWYALENYNVTRISYTPLNLRV